MKLTPTLNNTFILNENFIFRDVIVPIGFETNGADTPRIFWSLFPPFKPRYMEAIIIHDFLIKKGQISKANAYFEEILLSVENTFVTRNAVKLVRLYWKIKKVAKVKRVFND